MPPTAIVCADWSIDARRRDAYVAHVPVRRLQRMAAPAGGWTLHSLVQAAEAEAAGGSVLVGIDVPLGVPASLADAVGDCAAGATFLDWLCRVGDIPGFFETCLEAARWSPRQPFFSVDSGPDGLRRWTREMEKHGVSAYRAIDLATAAKPPLAVSGIPGSVGSATRDVWRAMLADAGVGDLRIWPFHGSVAHLTSTPGVVMGEIYPRAAYAIALTPGPASARSRLAIAKNDEDCRAAAIASLEEADWVAQFGVAFGGIEVARGSDDAFDALLSAAALLRCVLEETPLDSARTHPMEGGILGTGSLNLELRGRTFRCHPKGEIPPQPRTTEDVPVEQHPCPIPGCSRVFTATRSGWDVHLASHRLHPTWHPEVTDPAARKAIFRQEFPQFFGRRHSDRPAGDSAIKREAPDLELVLLGSLSERRESLQDLLSQCSGHWTYEDPVYRFYHQSFKVYALQASTQSIVRELQSLVPGRALNQWFVRIVAEGTGKTFTPADNQRWQEVTRPILEAFFHARFFLEMAVRYAHLDAPPTPLPSGYAALLYLYDLR